jgi:hypothetical protein
LHTLNGVPIVSATEEEDRGDLQRAKGRGGLLSTVVTAKTIKLRCRAVLTTLYDHFNTARPLTSCDTLSERLNGKVPLWSLQEGQREAGLGPFWIILFPDDGLGTISKVIQIDRLISNCLFTCWKNCRLWKDSQICVREKYIRDFITM